MLDEVSIGSVSGLRRDLPLSVVLGAGGVRGLAHVGALDVLHEQEFQIAEMIGTSVGALIIAFYAAVGLDIATLKEAGFGLKSSHLLWWALLRRSPERWRARLQSRAGCIPGYLGELGAASIDRLHHGIQRIGIVACDRVRGEPVLVHSGAPWLDLNRAVRGAAAIPRLFPPVRCRAGDRSLELVDGGVVNRLPLDVLLEGPFAPSQVLVIDISGKLRDRLDNAAKIASLRKRFGHIPIVVASAATLGGRTVVYKAGAQAGFFEAGRQSTLAALGISTSVREPDEQPVRAREQVAIRY